MSLESKCRAFKSPKILQNDVGSVVVASKTLKSRKVPKNAFSFKVDTFPSGVEICIPAKTVSEANNFEHWTKKDRRHKNQKKWVDLAFTQCKCQVPCTVKLTRAAPGFLDEEDNLRIALKWVKDHVAANLTGDFLPGRADGNKSIKWEYDQVKSKSYGVKISITH